MIGLLLLSRKQIPASDRVHRRSCRRLPGNIGWWETVWNTYTNERFKKTFRISNDAFKFISEANPQ